MYRARKGLRYLINDVQRPPDQVVSSSQTVQGTISYQLLNITQPVFSLHFLLRWQNDLTATYTSAPTNAVFGRNWFNCNGWLQPAGTSLPLRPMFTQLQMKSGNNNLLYQATIFDFLDDKAVRYYKNGASTVRGIPSASFAHVPTAPNSCSGSIDFSVVNQPIVFWTFNPTPPYATVGDWSNQDLGPGANSNLVISGIFMTHNNIDATNYDLIRTRCAFSCANCSFQVPSTRRRRRSTSSESCATFRAARRRDAALRKFSSFRAALGAVLLWTAR